MPGSDRLYGLLDGLPYPTPVLMPLFYRSLRRLALPTRVRRHWYGSVFVFVAISRFMPCGHRFRCRWCHGLIPFFRVPVDGCIASVPFGTPVTRQFETDYYRYYNWPFYWQGDFLWGPSDSPRRVQAAKQPSEAQTNTESGGAGLPEARPDPDLRSAQAVFGFPVYSGEDAVGKVTDFLMDDKNWRINYLVIKVGQEREGTK